MAFELPALPYDHAALEPHIDKQTMEIHHGKHHKAYVDNLNKALDGQAALAAKPLDALIADLGAVPDAIRAAVRNNGGGHWNHSLFWKLMAPKAGGEPKGAVADAIQRDFGSFAVFQEKFGEAATKRFGSGWVWLCLSAEKKLVISSTANQDNPLMGQAVAGCAGKPVLALDVWEHAYYLKYQNRRADYVKAFWNVVNWAEVERLFKGGK
ncbi:MAG: superoxide dismutase [Planctomycetes bacterium]|nr:superoxide dismutase [Planctomycetota bacterium]